MLCVGDSVTNHILQEDLEDTSGFFIDKPTDTLHSATPSQSTNCRLGDALNVIPENLTMPLGSSLSKSLSSFTLSLTFFSLLLLFWIFLIFLNW
ncbi:hypothetical protein OIU79_000151, partial [Salix purpurea]